MPTTTHQIKIGKQLGDLSEKSLRFYRQIGVEAVALPARFITEQRASRPLVPPVQDRPAGPQAPPWDLDELCRMCDQVRAFDLVPSSIALPLSGNILLGRPERDADIDRVCAALQIAGQAGLRVVTYNFTALRASAGYYLIDGGGRGGAHLRAFDFGRVRDLPPLENTGTHTGDQMWERLTYFLQAVVPAAEAAGVRLAMHPNDPPVPEFRGVAQPVRTVDGLRRVLATVDSPANTLSLDTGVITEMGEDAPAAIREFGARDRIGAVHFRNVSVQEPYCRYVETFLDEGDADMLDCMYAFQESGYTGWIDPDHTPGIIDDTLDTHAGWAHAIGQLLALRAAAEARAQTMQ